ncbi:MAG TPA: RNA polymerase sigma factor [Phaeodactylibacter sp.]|nr:RNA polymerase sigma factor [Phaeodactylibacter sp.]
MSKIKINPLVKTTHLQGVITRDVLQACIAGHRESQELLYNYFAPRLFGICLRYAHDYPTAQDLLQEGFIKVFNKLDCYRYEGSFEGWMKRIFVNIAIEHYRKSNSRKFFVEIDKAKDVSHNDSAIDDLAAKDLLKVIQKLPNGYRTVFNLYAIEGYNHREISKMLHISEGTSKSQLARARATLRKNIKRVENTLT